MDELDGGTERAYTAWPDRLYVIDKEGRVRYKSRPGPFGFEVEPLKHALEQVLGATSTRAAS